MQGSYMKAIVCVKYGPPEVLQLREVPKPNPRPGQLRVRIVSTVVTSSDCFVRSGKVSPALWLPMRIVIGFSRPRQPILGMVFAGQVESLGKDAHSFKEGDPIFGFDRFGFGTYAEYKCVSKTAILAAKPASVSYEEAAAIPYGGLLALSFLRRAAVAKGQNILIYGASGAVGTSAVQLAAFLGATITGVSSSANLELVRSLGAHAVIDYTQDADEPSQLYELVLDAVGKRKTSSLKLKSRRWLTPNGKYISVDDGSPQIGSADLAFLKELVEKGKLKPVVDRTFPLGQIVDAHAYAEKGHKKGNVVIDIAGNT